MPSAGSVHVDVLPDTKRFGPQLRTQLRQIAASTRSDISVRVRVDTGAAMTKLRALRTLADELDGRLVRMGTSDIGNGGTTGASTPLSSVGGTQTGTVRVNTTQATAALRGVSAQVSALNRKTATVRVRVDEKSARQAQKRLKEFSDASPAMMTAVSVLAPPAVPLAGAAVGGAAGLLPGATAGLTGLGAVALATIPGLVGVGKAMDLQKKAAEGAEGAMEEYQQALDSLTPHATEVMESLADLTTTYNTWQTGLQSSTMAPISRALGVAESNLSDLTGTVVSASRGLDELMVSAEKGLNSPYWESFISFTERQAGPTLSSLGRTIGWLTLGITGLSVSFEPLWDSMSAGMESGARSFADWANEADNFTGFVSWTIENGPMLLGVLGDVSGAIIDLGVAIAPIGLVYAEAIGHLAQGISWLAETAPGLLQLAVAAYTAHMGLQLLTRINQGMIQPLRELPGRLREYGDQLRNVGTAAGTATGSANGFRNAIGGAVGALGGPWGIAIAAGVAALGIFIAKKAEAEQKVRDYTEAVRADTGAIGENTRAAAANALETEGILELADRYGLSLSQVTDAATGNTDALSSVTAEIDRQIESYKQMETVGAAERARQEGHIDRLEKIRDALVGENQAISESVSSYQRSTEAMGGAQTAQEGVNGALAQGAANARDLRSALDELTAANIGATEAEVGFQSALDRANESVATNGTTLDTATEAGRNNKTALIGLAEATHTQTDAMHRNDRAAAEIIQSHERARTEFVRVARQMGLTEEAAEDLADEYLGIPSEVETAIRLRATGTYSADTGQMAPAGSQAGFYSQGGAVHGPGTKTSDSINARLSDGEFVQRAAAVDKYGVGFMHALNEGRVPKEELPGFATGGYFRRTEHIGEDAWNQINDHREDVRIEIQSLYEALVDIGGRDMAARYKKMLSEGGNGAVQRALSQRGVPYSWGGGGPSGPSRGFGRGANTVGFDCSSLMQYAWWPWSKLPRVTYSQINSGQAVTRSQAIPGDLLFPSLGHVTMYTGNGQMVHAPRTGDVVRTAPAYANPIAVRRPTRRADGGPVNAGQWSWVGEDGPELVKFSSPGQVYSTAESARIAAEARSTAAAARGGSAAPLVGSQTFEIHTAEHALREAVQEMTHGLKVARKGGVYADA